MPVRESEAFLISFLGAGSNADTLVRSALNYFSSNEAGTEKDFLSLLGIDEKASYQFAYSTLRNIVYDLRKCISDPSALPSAKNLSSEMKEAVHRAIPRPHPGAPSVIPTGRFAFSSTATAYRGNFHDLPTARFDESNALDIGTPSISLASIPTAQNKRPKKFRLRHTERVLLTLFGMNPDNYSTPEDVAKCFDVIVEEIVLFFLQSDPISGLPPAPGDFLSARNCPGSDLEQMKNVIRAFLRYVKNPERGEDPKNDTAISSLMKAAIERFHQRQALGQRYGRGGTVLRASGADSHQSHVRHGPAVVERGRTQQDTTEDWPTLWRQLSYQGWLHVNEEGIGPIFVRPGSQNFVPVPGIDYFMTKEELLQFIRSEAQVATRPMIVTPPAQREGVARAAPLHSSLTAVATKRSDRAREAIMNQRAETEALAPDFPDRKKPAKKRPTSSLEDIKPPASKKAAKTCSDGKFQRETNKLTKANNRLEEQVRSISSENNDLKNTVNLIRLLFPSESTLTSLFDAIKNAHPDDQVLLSLSASVQRNMGAIRDHIYEKTEPES